VEVQGVGFDAVDLAVGADFRLSLVEVGLSAGFAVQLFDLIRLNVKQVAVVRLLIRGGEPSEYKDVLLRELEEAAAFEADPVGIFLYFQVEGFPLVPPPQVQLLNQVSPLSPIEPRHHIERLIFEG